MCGSLALGRLETNLAMVDKVFDFMIKEIKEEEGEIGHRVLVAMRNRIEERRNEKLPGIYI